MKDYQRTTKGKPRPRDFPVRTLRWIVVFLACIALIVHALSVFNWYMDDAFISHMYARTLADTGVFAYSPGDPPHFGISNPLWVFILSPAYLLDLNGYLYEKILLLLSGSLTIIGIPFYLYRIFKAQSHHVLALSAFPSFLLAFSWNYTTWIVGGLETIFFAGVLGLASLDMVYRISRARPAWQSAIFFGLLGGLRPDGVGLLVIAVIVFSICVLFYYPKAEHGRRILEFMLAGFATVGVFAALIYSLTGAVVPSTYFIKVDRIDVETIKKGLDYVYDFIRQTDYLFATIVVLGLLLFLFRFKKLPRETILCIGASLLFIVGYVLGFIIPAGGDWMPGSRFLVHLYPIMAVLASVLLFTLLAQMKSASWRVLLWFVIIALPFTLLIWEIRPASFQSLSARFNHSLQNERVWFQPLQPVPAYPDNSFNLVTHLNEVCGEGKSLALTEGGFLAYYSGCRVFDLHGWSDLGLAMIRNQTNAWATEEFLARVFSKSPDFILLSGYRHNDGTLHYRLEVESALGASPVFQASYRQIGEFEGIDEIYRYSYDSASGELLSYFLYARQN